MATEGERIVKDTGCSRTVGTLPCVLSSNHSGMCSTRPYFEPPSHRTLVAEALAATERAFEGAVGKERWKLRVAVEALRTCVNEDRE